MVERLKNWSSAKTSMDTQSTNALLVEESLIKLWKRKMYLGIMSKSFRLVARSKGQRSKRRTSSQEIESSRFQQMGVVLETWAHKVLVLREWENRVSAVEI